MNNAHKNYIFLIVWIAGLMAIGMLIGNLTKSGMDVWYLSLNKSPLTPPGYVFGIVWSILYAMIGISGWFVWQSRSADVISVKMLYITQLLLNWSWTPLFFSYHLVGSALVCILFIALMVGLIIMKTYTTLRIVSFLFVPYLLWLLFATYLNFYIWQYNI